MPRLRGGCEHRIDCRHVIWSLVRKPGAFARYRYREEIFQSPMATAAAIDRIVHHSVIAEFDVTSYRTAEAKSPK